MLKTIKKISQNEIAMDFIKKITIILSIICLGLFAIESILPGAVIEVFNFNWLLFLIIGMMTIIFFVDEKKIDTRESFGQKITVVFLAILFLVTMFFVLYKISLTETFIYLVFCIVLIKQLKGLFE